jgi:serine/threonine-protein kinase
MATKTTSRPGSSSGEVPSAGKAERPRGDEQDPLGLFGSRLAGRLVVVRYLGQTSAAHIYRVIHTLMDCPCFLKIVEKDPSAEDGMPVRLRREAKAASQAKHVSVLRTVDAGVDGELAYLAQEWSDGPNLRALIDRGSEVPVPELLGLGLQLLDALCHLHRQGIVLRSFDPLRILVPTRGGRSDIKLFDLSRVAYVGEAPDGGESKRKESQHGFKLRSSRYMAPEEIREEPADPRSDLYSFGVLLFEMLTGEYPYATRGRGPMAYMASHLRDEPRELVTQDVPRDLPAILRRLLAKDPNDRFQTAEGARRAIEDVVVPDLMRFSTPNERHVLEAWRKRVRNGLGSTMADRLPPPDDDDEAPLGLI